MKMSWAKVTILGKANVGKSTLINRLLNRKVAGVTPVPGTTTKAIVGERELGNMRVFFIDTPGFLKPRGQEEELAMGESLKELLDTDLIYFLVDAHTGITKEDLSILEKLTPYHGKVPIFVVINKIDGVPKEKLLPFMQELSEELFWDEIVPVSARRGANIDELLKTTEKYLRGREGEPPEYLVNVDEKPLLNDIIREKLLTRIRGPAARQVRVEVEQVDVGEGRVYIRAFIVAERPSIKAMVIGKGGQMIKSIGTMARREMEAKFGKKVFLELSVLEEKKAHGHS